ncbi:MAG TPA: hypothetical protein VHC69_18555 [Polyangiaceae bacterium]|nr:hypothetical protein [Polyangiaceae bacterium]
MKKKSKETAASAAVARDGPIPQRIAIATPATGGKGGSRAGALGGGLGGLAEVSSADALAKSALSARTVSRWASARMPGDARTW